MQARSKTSALRILLGGVVLAALCLGATTRLHAADAPTPVGVSDTRDRGSSLVGTLDEAFPALSPRLRLSSSFESTTWTHAEDRIQGLRPRRAASAGIAGEEAPVDVIFPARASDPVVAEGDGVRVVLRARGAAPAPARILDGKLAYLDVYRETDSIHVVEERSTEEYLYLRSDNAPVRFEYDLVEARGAASVKIDKGEVHFLNAKGEGLVILAPLVVDAAGRRSSGAARWELESRTRREARRLVLHLDPAGLEYPLVVDPTWIRTGDLNVARQDGIGILLHNGKVLVMGGTGPAELYDIATGTWSPTGVGWPGRAYFAAVMLRNGKVLATGGSDVSTFNECFLYDPDSNSWSGTTPMGTPRRSHTATLLDDGTVLVVGGEDAATHPTAEIFDPYALPVPTWIPTFTPMSAGKARHSATRLQDGRVMVAGGVTGVGLVTPITEIYDPNALPNPTWTRVADLQTQRVQHSATLLPDGKVLVAGGGLIATNAAEIYDPGLDTWTNTVPLSNPRFEHGATLLPSGRVLVTGGFVSLPLPGTPLATAEIFDPVAPSWLTYPVPNMNFPRYRHATTMLPDGRVLVAGGFGPAALVTAELLDVDSPTWGPKPNTTGLRRASTATLLKDGRVLLTGGPFNTTAEVYDPNALPLPTWTPTGPLTHPRWFGTATLLNDGRVLLAGTNITAGGGDTAELYDPGLNSWTLAGPLAGNRYDHAAVLLPCGEVLVVGGESSSGAYLETAERFNPGTDTWRSTGSLNTARRQATATLLLDGRVLVTGGWNAGRLTSAEIYDPVTEAWSFVGDMTQARAEHNATLLPSGKVLIHGGTFGLQPAELFDPGSGLFVPTGTTIYDHGLDPTATLLPNGRVVLVGGFTNQTRAEVYDPVSGLWTEVLPGPGVPRHNHTATVLLDGTVLIVGGLGTGADFTAEIFDVGRAELPGWRPVLGAVTNPLVEGAPLVVLGTGFTGLGEGSGGLGYMHSATDYPLVQLHRVDNDGVRWLPVDPAVGWADTDFASLPVNNCVPGPTRVTVFTNGIPSISRIINVECLPPSVTAEPKDASICSGGTATFTVAATGDCPAYQWRKDTVPLTDSGSFSGTRTDTLTVAGAALAEAGSYDAEVELACSSQVATSAAATLTVAAFPPLSGVSAAFAGPPSVCPTCLGGTATESHLGGGGVTHQWGYRLVSAGPITPIPGQTGASYVLNGADFPGPASYFLVVTTTPASGCAGGPQESNEIPVDVALAVPADDVKYFTVTSRNTENVLEWVYPSGFATVSIHATSGPTCAPPTDPFSPVTWITDETGAAGMRHRYSHGGLTPGTTYCYTLFVDTGGGTYSAGRSNRGRPMSPGPVQWAFSTGVFSLTAPTVGGAGVIATSNDHVVHAMVRGASPPAGEWPVPWLPKPVGGPVQSRSPIIPIDVGPLPSNPVVYVGSQDGNVYVADAAQGGAVLDPWAPVALGGLPGQAAPAGMFKDFGGDYDLLLVGTRQDLADNRFYAIDPINGGPPIDFYDDSAGAGIGIINGMATVDYGNNRVYFASRKRTGGASTLWCLNLLSQSAPVFSLRWENTFDDIDSSPVLMGGRVYVVGALNGGRLYSVNADDGSFYALNIGDGQAKDFVFPDYWNPGDLYFAGDNSIWAMNDNGTNITFKPPLVAPVSLGGAIPTSGVLLVPGTQLLYVGANDGHLYEIDFSQDPPALKSVQLGDGLATVGSPSLDWPNDLIHVGTEAGVFYAVDIPLP